MVGNPHAAEDLVQEVFMKMLKFKRTFRDDGAFAPWMFRIARNASADQLRRAAREPRSDSNIDDAPDHAPTTEEDAAAGERSRLVKQALADLPAKGREVLLLSRFEFKTYEEIAHVLGCSPGAVKVRAHRAMKQLRSAYLSIAEEPST
jgi:RNA polymerase sigma-70 factor (ECF subfamily)